MIDLDWIILATTLFTLYWTRRISMNIDTLLDEIDAATTDTAVRHDEIVAALKASGGTLTPEQEARHVAIGARLRAIGANHADPVPTEPAPVEPAE